MVPMCGDTALIMHANSSHTKTHSVRRKSQTCVRSPISLNFDPEQRDSSDVCVEGDSLWIPSNQASQLHPALQDLLKVCALPAGVQVQRVLSTWAPACQLLPPSNPQDVCC